MFFYSEKISKYRIKLCFAFVQPQCRGYVDENNEIVASTARAVFPTESGMFWTIFLQYPALSWMDVARKASIMRIIRDVTASQTACSTNINVYSDLCVSNVETYQVAEYTES